MDNEEEIKWPRKLNLQSAVSGRKKTCVNLSSIREAKRQSQKLPN